MRNSLWNDFRTYVLYSGNVLNKLLAINIAVFILFGAINMVGAIIGFRGLEDRIVDVFSFPYQPLKFFFRPWSIFTYQFIHAGFGHIFWNLIMFLFAGRLFREYLGDKKLLSTYILGGVSGALLFMLSYNVVPFFTLNGPAGAMVGASASIMAILVAIATLHPYYTVYLMFLGPVRLVYIVLFFVVTDFLQLTITNSGGHLAHLGGVIYGFTYIRLLQNGYDIGAWLNRLLERIHNLFRKPSHKPKIVYYNEGKAAANNRQANAKATRISQDEVDAILEKINRSGYESLTQREKEILFRASKEN